MYPTNFKLKKCCLRCEGNVGAHVSKIKKISFCFQIQPPSMGSVLDMLNIINGILFVQISQQDIENFKLEFEKRQQNSSGKLETTTTAAAVESTTTTTKTEESEVKSSPDSSSNDSNTTEAVC